MRLLIVDDEPSILQFMQTILRPLGDEILALGDSSQAVARVEKERFDGMILDVRMPHPNGFEITRRARASEPNAKAPIALLTGFDDVETLREGFQAGATCLLGKPVTREKLHSLLGFMRGPVMLARRRNARLPYRGKVNCSTGALRTTRFQAMSINLGEGGMLLEPSGGVQVGQEMFLEFEIPTDDRWLHMRAEVVRREAPDRIAVRFLNSSIRDREAIQEFILQQLQKESLSGDLVGV